MLTSIETIIQSRINSGAAALNRQHFAESEVLALSITGGPSCGKTSLIREAIKRLSEEVRVGVILGNIRAEQDAEQVRAWSSETACIEAVDLNAELVREALTKLDLANLDVLFIERASAAPPMPEDLGQTATIGIFSVAGGDDKVLRHPEHVAHADVVVLSKCDLLPFVNFDKELFRSAVSVVNPAAPIMEVSAVSREGLDEFCHWVLQRVQKHSKADFSSPFAAFAADYFVG